MLRPDGGDIAELRTEFSRTVGLDDGTFETEISTEPMHVKVGKEWLPVDTTLRLGADGRASTARGPAAVTLPADVAAGPVRVAGAEGWLDAELVGARGAVVVRGDTGRVDDALPGVDLELKSTVSGLKETLVLEGPQSGSEFTYLLRAPRAWSLSLVDGAVSVRDVRGAERMVLPRPFMDDSAGAHSDDVAYALERRGSAWELRVSADPEWLADPARVWPVLLDPTTNLKNESGTLSCELVSGAPDASSCGASTVSVGNSESGVHRAIFRYPGANSVIPSDAQGVQATLYLPVTAATGDVSIDIAPLTKGFTSAATWNSAGGSTWATPGGDTGPVETRKVVPAGKVGGIAELHLTRIAAEWLIGERPNLGFQLRATTEGAGGGQVTFSGATGLGLPNGSVLKITWGQKVGRHAGQQFYDRQLTDRAAAHVNVANGNLALVTTDYANAAPGIPVEVTRTFNSGSPAISPLGRGWKLDTGRDVQARVAEDGTLRYYSPTGAGYLFYPKLNGGYYDPPGLGASAVRNANGTVDITYHDNDLRLRFAPDSTLTYIEDRNGNRMSFAYNGDFQPDRDPYLGTITDTAGRVINGTHGYYMTGLEDASGRTVSYDVVDDKLLSVTDAAGGTTTYTYDTSRRVVQVDDPIGNVTKFTYDAVDRATSMTQVTDTSAGTGPTTTFSYTDPPKPTVAGAKGTTVLTDPNGNQTTYTWDTRGQVVKVKDALGRERSKTYGPDMNVLTSSDAMGSGTTPGNETTFGYDAKFNATSAKLPTGATASASYDISATSAHPYLPTSTTDPQGRSTSYTYDGPGNVTKTSSSGPNGAVELESTYNAAAPAAATCGGKPGQKCTDKNGRGVVTSYGYDGQGNLTSITHPAPRGTESRTYDTMGRVATSTDGRGQVTTYVYDNLDRVLQTRLAGASACASADIAAGRCIKYTYDADGNLLSMADHTGTTSYGYDRLNRQTSTTQPGVGSMSVTYDAGGNVTSYTDAGGTVSYRYNADNTLKDLAEPGGSCTASPAVKCTVFGYDNNGARTSTTYPGGTVMTTSLDNSGRVTRIRAVNGSTVLSDVGYGYAAPPVGGGASSDTALRQKKIDSPHVGGPSQVLTTTFGYDGLTRLVSAVEKTSGGTTVASWSYRYDNAGNRTSASVGSGASITSQSFGYNNADQLTSRNGSGSGWSYDAAGNETAAASPTAARTGATWGSTNQLTAVTSAGAGMSFGYAGAGNDRRVSLTTGGATSVFSLGQLGLTAAKTGTTSTYFTRDPQGTLVSMRTGTTSRYYLFDGLGSVVGLADAAGGKVATYSYHPYGEPRTTTGTAAASNPYRFTGSWLDTASGLYKMGVRYYDPALGRFTQPDPTGQDPHYTYAGNNPTNYTDPSGAAWQNPLSILKHAEQILAPVILAGVGMTMIYAGVITCTSVIGCLAGGYAIAMGGLAIVEAGYMGYRTFQKYTD